MAGTKVADALVEQIDGLLLAGEFALARDLISRLDLNQLPPEAITGAMMVTKAAKEQLGEEREVFVRRACAALAETWKLHADAVEAIRRRHG